MQKSVVVVAFLLIAVLLVGGFFLFSNRNQSNYGNINPSSSGSQSSNSTQTGSGSSEQQASKTYNISIQNSAFQSPLLMINVGDTVVWTNKDSMPHTVTSDSGNELDSSTLSGATGGYYPKSGGSYSHTFTTEGTYDYHCSVHPGMKGEIVVG